MPPIENEVLAAYKSISSYNPAYGDFVIWTGFFTTWHGIVSDYDSRTDELMIVFSSVPFLLLTMTEEEIKAETRRIKLSKIRSSRHGTWAVIQYDKKASTVLWYV